ncbi:DUF5808 domain-containing protein [Clostridium culturomicium]|uniref:DUF5808 domain-containing protein n=1 Tax=Clostridium culturomicium TaxID=1499683 RepID=UPI0038573B5F
MDRIIGLVTVNSFVIVLFLVSYFLNRLSNNGIFFGVRFPMEHFGEQELLDLDKAYKKIISIVYIILFIAMNFICLKANMSNNEVMEWIVAGMSIGTMLISNVIFIIYHFKAKRLKKENGWTYKKRNVVVTDTTLRKPKKDEKFKSLNSKWFLLLLAFPIVMGTFTLIRFNQLPQVMEISNSTFGVVKPHTLRGKLIIFQFPLTQFFMGILMYGINIMINKSKVDLNSGSIEGTVIRKKKFRRLGSMMMFVTALQMMLMFSVIQGSILWDFDITIINYIFVISLFLTMIAFMVMFIRMGQGGRNLQKTEEKDELYKDDDDKWILGGFYFNKNDPAWMVEKRTGVGWTVNFANPKSWIAMVGLIIFIIVNILISIAISK